MHVQGFPDLATSGNAVSPGRLEGTISGPIPGLLSQNLHFNMAPDHNVGGNWETSGRICISNKFLEDSARFWTLACTLGSTLEFWETLPWRLCGSAPLTFHRKKQSSKTGLFKSHKSDSVLLPLNKGFGSQAVRATQFSKCAVANLKWTVYQTLCFCTHVKVRP